MTLYTVELQNKHIVSMFNDKGVKIGEKTEIIKQVIRDLPSSTVAMYKEKTKGALVITAQAEEAPVRSDAIGRTRRENKAPAQVRDYTPSASPKSAQSSIQKAAERGDMAAALNVKDA